MNKNIDEKLKSFTENHKKLCFVLVGWKNLNNKNYSMKDMLTCIYMAANGSVDEMIDIIETLTMKKKVYGRTQVYSVDNNNIMDIVKDSDGELVLKGYGAYNPKPLKGQHVERNKKIFKNDGEIKKSYQQSVEKMFDLGARVRKLYPDGDNHFITFAMQSIKKYAIKHKKNPLLVVARLESGKYKMDDNFVINDGTISENSIRGKYVLINESDLEKANNLVEMTEYKFLSNIKTFIGKLLQDPVNTQPTQLLSLYNLTRKELLNYLISNDIIRRESRLSDKDADGNPKKVTMLVKFLCPKKDFNEKLAKMYIDFFGKDENMEINEDGEGCVTTAASSGAFVGPFMTVVNKK